ncbi:acyltransferase [bacterium]|nr:acyltransferase [bacterium]
MANFLLLEPYFGFSSRLMVSWSLVYEWGFYVLMAAGLLYLRIQPKREVAFLGGILLALAGLLGFHCGILLPLKFWPEFMIGVCVFAFLQNGRPLWRGLVLAPSVGFGLLLCILHKWDKPLSGSKPLRWLRRVGLFSYSLYLVHVPFGGAFRNLCMRFVSETSPGFAIVQIGYVTTCLITAYVFHRFVEAPWEKFRKSTFC